MFTDYIIFGKETHFSYHISAGIKQGLPLSPWLFLFYLNDIFDVFEAIYGKLTLHLLIHADDTTIIANDRESAIQKLGTLIQYCKQNYIKLQLTKCEFIVINGDHKDKADLQTPLGCIRNKSFVTLLGCQFYESGIVSDDIKLQLKNRFFAAHRFYNYLRANKLAPIVVKLKVLEACVLSALLSNCETFGKSIPKELESLYLTLIKSCLGVRRSVPNKLALMESGLPSLKALIYGRQLKFYRTFLNNLQENSARKNTFDIIYEQNQFLEHYKQLDSMYADPSLIKTLESRKIVADIQQYAAEGRYKFQLYVKLNPNLVVPDLSTSYATRFTRLRLSSHSFPIELGRWSRTNRENRLCSTCGILGDEYHYIYTCTAIDRSSLGEIPAFHELSEYVDLPQLLYLLKNYL